MTHDERVQGLLEANNLLLDLARKFKAQLRKNHAKFTFYMNEHNAKAEAYKKDNMPLMAEASRAKAIVNEAMALEIEVLLAQH